MNIAKKIETHMQTETNDFQEIRCKSCKELIQGLKVPILETQRLEKNIDELKEQVNRLRFMNKELKQIMRLKII